MHTSLSCLMDSRGTLSLWHIFMSHFQQCKSDGNQQLIQPFRLAPGDYEIYFHANAVCIYVCMFMKGEDDRQLQWPFEHDATNGVYACDWKRDKNHVLSLSYPSRMLQKNSVKNFKSSGACTHRIDWMWMEFLFAPFAVFHGGQC